MLCYVILYILYHIIHLLYFSSDEERLRYLGYDKTPDCKLEVPIGEVFMLHLPQFSIHLNFEPAEGFS